MASGSIFRSTSAQVSSRSRVMEMTFWAISPKNLPTTARSAVFAAIGTTPWRASRQRKELGTPPSEERLVEAGVVEERDDPVVPPAVGRRVPDPLQVDAVEDPGDDLQPEQDQEHQVGAHCGAIR